MSFGWAKKFNDIGARIFNYIWQMDKEPPEGHKPIESDKDLETCLASQFKSLSYAAYPPLIEKAKKLYKSIAKNRMTILYGPTLSAKSTILKASNLKES